MVTHQRHCLLHVNPKMFQKNLFQFLRAWMVVFLIGTCSADLNKRIINGVVMQGRKTGYDAVRYFAAIGTVHGQPFYQFFFKGPSYRGHVSCSGALLTPEIVQTACHCVSEWETDRKNDIRRPLIEHNWEGYRVVYVGVNDQFGKPTSMETVSPITSRQFLVHQKCAEFSNRMMTHDYGWIMIDPSWNTDHSGVPIENMVGFAPTYAEKELAKIWDVNTQKAAICLHMGFGASKTDDSDNSEKLLHGWAVMLNMDECWSARVHGIHANDIEQYLNFFCSKNFPKHSQPIGPADSGSPVTCKNFHFGVGSGAAYDFYIPSSKRTKVHVSYDGGIVFAPFENAVEYRKEFMGFIRDYEKLTYKELIDRYENNTRTFKPPERFSGDLQLRSKSFSGTRKNLILLFFVTAIAS